MPAREGGHLALDDRTCRCCRSPCRVSRQVDAWAWRLASAGEASAWPRVAARIRATRAPMIRARRMQLPPVTFSGCVARILSPGRACRNASGPASLGWPVTDQRRGPAAGRRGVRAVGRVPALLAAARAGRRARDPRPPGAVVADHDGPAGGAAAADPRSSGRCSRTGGRSCSWPSRRSSITFNWATYIYGVNNGRVVETSLGYFINPLVTVLMGVLHPGRAAASAAVVARWGSRRSRSSCSPSTTAGCRGWRWCWRSRSAPTGWPRSPPTSARSRAWPSRPR